MDCEKYEPLLLDELYDELDELTSAAVKRHVAGCARCASIFNGMRATRRLATLPLVPVPAGLEDRILAAAKEAQKVVPIRSRFSRAVSLASTWAMRPQTAMAAVFLLMIGTGTFLIRSKSYSSRESSSVSVTVQGTPSPTSPAQASNEALDDKAAAAAHGPSVPPNTVTLPPPAASAVAAADEANGFVDRITDTAGRDKAKDTNALGGLAAAQQAQSSAGPAEGDRERSALAGKGTADGISNAGAPGGAPFDLGQQVAPAKPTQSRRGGVDNAQDPFSLGAAAYRARNFAEATRQFDSAASQNADPNAALWAARATKEGNGCGPALPRFERVSQSAPAGSWLAHEASLEAARCEIAMGQLDPARDRLNALVHVPSHQTQAQQSLNELNQVAARKAGGSGSGGAAAAPHPAPARAPAARSGGEKASEKKAIDSNASGY